MKKIKLIISQKMKEKFPDLNLVLLPVYDANVKTGQDILTKEQLKEQITNMKKKDFFDNDIFSFHSTMISLISYPTRMKKFNLLM